MTPEADLVRLYNAFDPLKTATEREYVNTASVRGSDALAREFTKHLRLSESHLNFLFSGHIGGGKSTELKHLAHCLRKGDSKNKGARYFPIVLDILDYVDVYNVTTADILLAIVAEVGHVFREDSDLKILLQDSLIRKRFADLWGSLTSDVQVDETEISLGDAKTKVSLLKRDPGRRKQVREALDQEPARFQDEVNSVLSEARVRVKEKGFQDIVVLIDSLDRVERSAASTEKLASHRGLFLESALAFTDLKVHKLLVLPLSLVRANGMSLSQRYGSQPFVLPVIKVERRDHERYDDGYHALCDFVKRRADPLPCDTVIEKTALDYLIKNSGGHPRMFTRFMSEALADVDDLPITFEVARRAVRPTIATLVPAVEEAWWPILAKLELSDLQQIDEADPNVQRMLDELMILEYRNGEQEASETEENAPWYAVNPILRETRSFQAAVESLRNPNRNGSSD